MKERDRIAIFGGSGYVGSALAKCLSKRYVIRIIDVNPLPENLKENVEYERVNILNYDEVENSLKDCDFAIHTAIIQIPLINEQIRLGYEVNIIGTQNICRAVDENKKMKGMILCGTWHTIGEMGLRGLIDEEFGFRPDKVEGRARLYSLSKMAQEAIVRFYDEMTDKIFGIIRMGTVLGPGMPEKTAANIFIERGLKGESITPYQHSMYRPMLYVDIRDICRAFEIYSKKILNNTMKKSENSLANIVNVYYPEPITIFKLAEIIKNEITDITDGKMKPNIEIVDKGIQSLFTEKDVNNITIDIHKLKFLLNLNKLKSPKESIRDIIKYKLKLGYEGSRTE